MKDIFEESNFIEFTDDMLDFSKMFVETNFMSETNSDPRVLGLKVLVPSDKL